MNQPKACPSSSSRTDIDRLPIARITLQGVTRATAVLLLLIAGTGAVGAQETPSGAGPFFDTDRQEWLPDADGDGYPDLTEQLGGTDPYDPAVHPDTEALADEAATKVGFPTSTCRAGFRQAGNRLCITSSTQSSTEYPFAERRCRVRRARVCTYADLYYLIVHGSSSLLPLYDPRGKWLGDWIADDRVLVGNKNVTSKGDPDRFNFEGTRNKRQAAPYWCCHDDQ